MNNNNLNNQQSDSLQSENKQIREHYTFLLENVYDYKTVDLEKMSIDELKKLLEERQQEKAKEKSIYNENPNKFWMIKGMPKPKEHKVNSSTKGGLIVFLVWCAVMLLTGAGFMVFAFLANR
ncbi:hypothetical protein [Mycoplasmopsis caviae]|uniref:Uncharacterized protein n=1 Tax=Mycoplasmopsis caviae TaxID=55603 RepID=A0A3P8MF70_9BACT|nr:hypothetical protein [Mycoplasmopsis caviae]VDR41793.1 Uncharacterised protein [Mycoplasmopsis caviae]